MDVRQLRYFLAVARCGSFTAASHRIRTAQPALSAQISKLEAEIGCPLFTRLSRGVALTSAGQRLLAHAEQIVNSLEDARRDVRLFAGLQRAEVVIGLPPLSSLLLTVPLLEAARAKIPQVSVHICEGMSSALRDWLDEGRLDMAIVHNIFPHEVRDAEILFEEDLYVGALASSNLIVGEAMSIDQLASIPLIASSARNGHRRVIDAAAGWNGVKLNIVSEIDSVVGQRELVLRGVGALVMPLLGFENWPKQDIKLVPFSGKGLQASAHLVLGRRKIGAQTLSRTQKLMMKLIGDLIDGGQWPGARRALTSNAKKASRLIRAPGARSDSASPAISS